MAKNVTTVLLNELQMSHVEALREHANDKGVVHRDVLAQYKQNVVNALLNRSVLVAYKNGDARLNPSVNAQLLVRKTRQPKVVASEEVVA